VVTPLKAGTAFESFFPIPAASTVVISNVEQLLRQLLMLGPDARFERDFSNDGATIVLHQSAPAAGTSVLHVPTGLSTYAFVAEKDSNAFDAVVAKLVSNGNSISFSSANGFKVVKDNSKHSPAVSPNPLLPFTIVGVQFNSQQ
jgi:hypothetical protein